jgi:hypothetical protein
MVINNMEKIVIAAAIATAAINFGQMPLQIL